MPTPRALNVSKSCMSGDSVCVRHRNVSILIAVIAAILASPIDELILVATGIITIPVAVASSSVATTVFWVIIPVVTFIMTFLIARWLLKWLARRRS